MAISHTGTDTIRIAVSSTTTCTPETATLLADFLLPKHNKSSAENTENLRDAKRPISVSKVKSTTKPSGPKAKSRVAKEANKEHQGEPLSPKERSILATEVINAALKSLSEAIKIQPTTRNLTYSKDSVKRTLRRSSSEVRSPLKPRSLNRISTAPNDSCLPDDATLDVSISAGQRATAECARIAFSCLRALQASKSSGVKLPDLQIETGMSVLIGKLISLGLEDIATKELRILKKMLHPQPVPATTKKPSPTTLKADGLAELLDFSNTELTGNKLGLAISTQLQVLKLLASCRKAEPLEAALPFLEPSYPSSPIKLLLLATHGTTKAQVQKVARQIQSLSELMLSLSPSISTAEDSVAVDSRAGVAPDVAFQFQSIALCTRLSWWKLADHQGDIVKDVLDPYFRCLTAFVRRNRGGASSAYERALSNFTNIKNAISEYDATCDPESESIMAGIYQLFCSLSQEAGCLDETKRWIEKLQSLQTVSDSSTAKSCAITARLVALSLREVPISPNTEGRLLDLLEALERPFKGPLSEIEDLLTEISTVRRISIVLLAKGSTTSENKPVEGWTSGLNQMCESLVFVCPRLFLRYLGNAPSPDSPAKDTVRFEQRRQFITKLASHGIDSALFLTKVLLSEGRLPWDLMDSILQDCLGLLDRLGSISSTTNGQESSISPYVRISNLYYAKHINMCKDISVKDSQSLRALKRSVDCINLRSRQERNSAHLHTKLERMAGIYRKAGRHDESLNSLTMLRDDIIDSGALIAVVNLAATRPLLEAFGQNEATVALGRVTEMLLKVMVNHTTSTSQFQPSDEAWTSEERGVILEYQLKALSTFDRTSNTMLLGQRIFQDLLTIYDESQFPIRRLRATILFLSLNYPLKEIPEEYARNIDLSKLDCTELSCSKDAGLQQYRSHLQALLGIHMELRQDEPNTDNLKSNLSVWYSICENYGSSQALNHQIEDVASLILYLQGTVDFMQMKGHDAMAVAVLQLIATLCELDKDSDCTDDTVLSFIRLGMQWLHLGYSEKAAQALGKAQDLCSLGKVSLQAEIQLHLSHADYQLAVGNTGKCKDSLLRAQELFIQNSGTSFHSSGSGTTQKKTLKHRLISNAFLVYSMLDLQEGSPEAALNHAKQAVRLLRRAWSIAEEQSSTKDLSATPSPKSDLDKITEEVSNLNLSTVAMPQPSSSQISQPQTNGSEFWVLIRPLFKSLSHLSTIYAHHGMFQETIYYSEQALRIAKEVGSRFYIAFGYGSMANIWLKAGDLEKSADLLLEAKKHSQMEGSSYMTAALSYYMGCLNRKQGNYDAEIEAYEEAETILTNLQSIDFINSVDQLLISRNFPLDKSNAAQQPKRKITVRRKAVAGRKPLGRGVEKQNKSTEVKTSSNAECSQLAFLHASTLRRKAEALGLSKRCDEALEILHRTDDFSSRPEDKLDYGIVMAKHLLLHSIEELNGDPVYGSLQDSTISFPSVSEQCLDETKIAERSHVAKTQLTKRKTTSKRGNPASTAIGSVPKSFFDKLLQAHDILVGIHSTALASTPVSVIHTVSSLLNSIALLLSATCLNHKPLTTPSLANCYLENARSLALAMERRAIQVDQHLKQSIDDSWPALLLSDSSSIAECYDVCRFQQDYVDIIPPTWTVISMAMSDSLQELTITRLQAGHTPFVLRLPLTRHSALDPDEEVFDFEQGRSELLEIIDLTNQSAHDARDMSTKGAKAAWWEEREALDARLKDLLENIEKVWLGGFRGVFSQEERRPDLLARFQRTFQDILDKYLPSRRQTAKKCSSHRVSLDTRILDLFIGLGDPSDEETDLSEPLNDLLYFIVDILQFHGEFNAYDEIDVDSILVETQEALRCYHDAAREHSMKEQRHTVLILDKALHAFPWESLPCMDGHAVSRLPSLGCLRERILEQRKQGENNARGLYINRESGSYILNPGGDLNSTQATFENSLQGLESWQGIVKREPSEIEMRESLGSKELFLYFGHGSGAQYIRAREIRKLEKCAVTMLMGCSSGALTDAGEFEPYGPAINYMHAGCPALVATLWDVTDKDIDRFAQRTLEQWGLFKVRDDKPADRSRRGKERKMRKEESPREGEMSLVEAVAKGREACNLKYLNGAALCVYGVPVFLR